MGAFSTTVTELEGQTDKAKAFGSTQKAIWADRQQVEELQLNTQG